jgi:hypothetical protein
MLCDTVLQVNTAQVVVIGLLVQISIFGLQWVALTYTIRKDHQKKLDEKADKIKVTELEHDLKEEIKCIEESQIRENKELKKDYQKAVDEVKAMVTTIYNAILTGKIEIKP